MTFSFFPLLVIPDEGAELDRLVATFAEVAEHGLGVYERTRDALRERFVEAKHAASRADGRPRRFTTLSFHDTMNHTGWVDPDPEHIDRLAHACMAAWDAFRAKRP